MVVICRRHAFDAFLVSLLILLTVVFVRRYSNKSNSVNEYIVSSDDQDPVEVQPARLNPAPDRTLLVHGPSADLNWKVLEVDPRVKEISDIETPGCTLKSVSTRPNVTLIIDFSDYQFFDVKHTISSLHATASWGLIGELLLIDDASSLEYIRDDVTRFMTKLPKTRLLRGNYIEPLGQARARMLGVRHARSDIVVFLDSKTLVTRGWLEPLIDAVVKDPKVIAVPHLDIIKDPVSLSYQKTSDKSVATFSWNLSIRMKEVASTADPSLTNGEDGNKDDYEGETGSEGQGLEYKSPVLRGNVFGVNKKFFESIGGYDEALEDVGGEHLELSLRVWLCGGKIIVLTCSRVGVLNLNDPVKVTSHRNTLRIAELWFNSHKSTVYRSSSMSSASVMMSESNGIKHSVEKRRKLIESQQECKDIDWYLKNIATSIVTPSHDAMKFGILKIRTGRCSRLLPTMRIKLDDCKPEHFNKHPPEMIFELNKAGQIKVMNKCLTVKNNAYILAEECRDGDTHQKWKHLTDQLINIWSTYCAMHVTDPDKSTEGDRQILMAQECGTDSQKSDAFKKIEFVAV